MKNKYIKFCDKHKLTSGVMREMLIHGKSKEALISIKEYKNELLDKVQVCEQLYHMVLTDKESPDA